MIQWFSTFFSIFYLIIIFWAHWGVGLLLIVGVLFSIISHIGKTQKWSNTILSSIENLFYSSNLSCSVTIIYTVFFFLIVSTNLIGIFTYNQHVLLSSIILVLIRLVFFLWLFSYVSYINRRWNYLTNTLMVNIVYPSLSLLLRNIEILTHIFRPLTLIARIWVNMWVGHCILSIMSFMYIKGISVRFSSWITAILFPIAQCSLFLYELIIILLQSTVIVYLSIVYYNDNLKSTIEM